MRTTSSTRYEIFSKRIIALALWLVIAAVPLATVGAEDYGNYGLDNTMSSIDNLPGKTEINTSGSARNFFASQLGRIVGFFLAFTGVAFMILMIAAGTIWMNAGGNEQAVAKAKNLIIAAVIGLIITLAAYAITKLLGDFLTARPTP